MSLNENNIQLTGNKKSQSQINIVKAGKIKLPISRRQRRKQARLKYALIEAQTSNNSGNSQFQPPNVCTEDSTNTWTPNLPPMVMQNMPQESGSQPQVPWSQPQESGSQPQVPWSQQQEPWSQLQATWPQPQAPCSQPDANTPSNIFNFGPTNIVGNSFPQSNIEHPLNNMGILIFPHQSNYPKKKKNKAIVQQQPKKLKSAELSFEAKQQREAELRIIEQKYRQVVMIHRSVSQSGPNTPAVPKKPKAKVTPSKQKVPVGTVVPSQIKAPVVPNKPKAEVTPLRQQEPVETVVRQQIKAPAVPNKPGAIVTPSKQQAPVETVLTPQIKIIGNTTITPIPRLQPTTKPKRIRQRSRKNKKNQMYNPYTPQVGAASAPGTSQYQASAPGTSQYQASAPGTSQYQAPHQDEPEDLTDDLAPNGAQHGGPQQPGAQPRAVTTENKLNFKFQRSVPKNPDWSEYQNKFRRIGGGSPEPGAEPEGAARVKQEPDQPINTGFIFEEDVEMKEVVPVHIDTSDLRVAVTTEPFLYLNEDQVKEINEALVNKVQDAIFSQHLSYVPTFEDIPVHNLGHLPLKCQSPKDLIWLHQTLSAIPAPTPVIKLVIRAQASIPNMVKVKLFVPNYSGNLEELRYLLQKQNHWYDMSSWMLVKSEKQGDDPSNYSLEYRVPEKEALIIDNRDRRVSYSLGTCFATVSDETINAEKVFKHRNVAKHLQVCVLTEPFRYLTLLEVELIKLALIYKLEKDAYSENEYIPTFRGCPSHYKGGLKLWCESDRDLKWLKDAINSLVSPAIGTKLTIKEQAGIPQRAKMTIVVPTTEDESFIMKVLKSQNSWCDVDSWTLFSTWLEQKSSVVCVFYIPHKHIRLIKDRNCRLSFLLGYVKADITTE